MNIVNKYIVLEDEKPIKFDTLGEAYKYALQNISARDIYKKIEVKLVEKTVSDL